MNIDIFTATGTKKGSMALPESIFGAPIRQGLMHLALVRQLSNRRTPVAHVKHRGEIVGSTKKVYQQKGTGRARRGPIRSPLMRGGGKSFGPRSEANFEKNMPREMRRAALLSCLSWAAKKGSVVALESYPDEVKTKKLATLLGKMPVEAGRKVLVVLPAHHRGLELSARNMPKVKTLLAPYLNPEDVLGSKLVVFLVDAIKVAEETFGARKDRKVSERKTAVKEAPAAEKPKKKAAAKPKAAKKPAAEKDADAKPAKKAPAKKKAASADSK